MLYEHLPAPVAGFIAGAGDLGIEQAGFDVLVAVEYDPVHAATYVQLSTD